MTPQRSAQDCHASARVATGALAAVLSITAPAERLPDGRMDELLPQLQDAAARISGRLSHRPS